MRTTTSPRIHYSLLLCAVLVWATACSAGEANQMLDGGQPDGGQPFVLAWPPAQASLTRPRTLGVGAETVVLDVEVEEP